MIVGKLAQRRSRSAYPSPRPPFHHFKLRAESLRGQAKTYKEFVKIGRSGDPHVRMQSWPRECVSPASRSWRAADGDARTIAHPYRYAVYVETLREAPGRIRPQERDALQRNIALAEVLGATIVRVKADRPGDGLIAFAKREGITHVVFGQTARTRWEILLKGSTLNRFLEEVRDAAVQVVPLGEAG